MSPQGACRAHTALAPPSRAWLWIPPGGPKEFRLGVAHTFCPLFHPQRPPRRPRPRRRSPRLHNHPGPSVKHTKSIQSFVSSLSCPPESQPTLSSPEMSLQSTLVKITLDSPRFARFLHRQQSPRVVSFPWATYYPTMTFPKTSFNPLTFPKSMHHPLVI